MQTEAWHKVEAEMKTLEEDRNKWQQQAGLLRDSLKKQETLASSTVAKLTQQESENISLKKVHISYRFNRYYQNPSQVFYICMKNNMLGNLVEKSDLGNSMATSGRRSCSSSISLVTPSLL
jgi:hypothetical protein